MMERCIIIYIPMILKTIAINSFRIIPLLRDLCLSIHREFAILRRLVEFEVNSLKFLVPSMCCTCNEIITIFTSNRPWKYLRMKSFFFYK